jgi:hypothetical protein
MPDLTKHVRKTDKERQMVSLVSQMAYKSNFLYGIKVKFSKYRGTLLCYENIYESPEGQESIQT